MSADNLDPLGGGYLRDGMEPNESAQNFLYDPIKSNISKIVTSGTAKEDDSSLEQGSKVETQRDIDRTSTIEHAHLSQHVGFWHHSMVNVRLHVLKLWARTGTYGHSKILDQSEAECLANSNIVLILLVFVMLVLSLFSGVFMHIPKNFSSLNVYVVDFDGQMDPNLGGTPMVGPQVVQMTQSMRRLPAHLGYITMSPAEFEFDPINVRQAVYDFKAHAAIIINANATALLWQAAEQGNATYDPYGAAQIIYISARDQTTIPTYVVPQLVAFEKAFTTQFGIFWARSLMQNTTISRSNLENAPQVVSPAVGFTTYDLRPYGPAAVTPAVSIGLIYLIIIAFFSFTFFLPIHLKYISPRGHPPLHFHQLIVWRWFATVAAYFLLSLGYSFVALAFQVPFSNSPASHTEPASNPNAYGAGTFVVYWMINFLGMSALGLACENVAMALGQPWTAMWLIFWVISNVSTGFYSLDLSPRFYYWGYAFPLHQGKSAPKAHAGTHIFC